MMTRISAGDLKKIKEKVAKESALAEGGYTVKITVHLGTCGIAAGGDEALKALQEEIEKSKRDDIKVMISACMGMCSSEPNVTVRRAGEEAVLYRGIDGEKMRKVFESHVLKGEIQTDYAMARMK